jgi:hypothetical protein
MENNEKVVDSRPQCKDYLASHWPIVLDGYSDKQFRAQNIYLVQHLAISTDHSRQGQGPCLSPCTGGGGNKEGGIKGGGGGEHTGGAVTRGTEGLTALDHDCQEGAVQGCHVGTLARKQVVQSHIQDKQHPPYAQGTQARGHQRGASIVCSQQAGGTGTEQAGGHKPWEAEFQQPGTAK